MVVEPLVASADNRRTPPLRVVHVIGGGDTGGAMAHLLPLIAALRRAGCDASLLCLGGGGLTEVAAERGLPTEVLPMASSWDVRVLRPLLDRLDHFPWDVVHTHGMRANLPVRLLSPVLRRRPCLFTTVHSDLSLDYPARAQAAAYRWLDRVTMGRVDQVVCVSDDLRRRLQHGPVGREHPIVIPSGLESPGAGIGVQTPPPVALSAGGDPAVLRGRTALSGVVWDDDPPRDGAPRLGTVTRLVPVKDLDLFLEAVVVVRERVPDVRVAVVGDGPEGPRLRARSASLGLDGVVTWSGEVRPGALAVREFDVFLLTSASEGLPVAVLEAMGAGVPVVSTAVGGLPEVVVEGATGYLVPASAGRARVAADLADRVVALLSDPSGRAAMGSAAARRVERVFSVDATAARLLAAYERCLAGKHPLRHLGTV